jgi:RimJ/RimL family protein N-acetyltransferase
LNLYRAHPEWIGWLNWYGIRTDLSKQVLCGSVGFLGPPGEDGKIDIGYSVLPEHQRCGIATEMVAAVVDWAFASKQVRSIDAQTEVENRASIRVLVANGFRETGPGGEPGTIRYRREPAPDAVR